MHVNHPAAAEQSHQYARTANQRLRRPSSLRVISTCIHLASLQVESAPNNYSMVPREHSGIRDVQKVPMEKQVAAPPTMTKSRSFVSTRLEPIIRGRGIVEGGRSRLIISTFDSDETTIMSSSRLIYPCSPMPPRTIKDPRSWTQAAPNLERRTTVSFSRTSALLKVMVGPCACYVSFAPLSCPENTTFKGESRCIFDTQEERANELRWCEILQRQ